MPELPEVETVRNTLRSLIVNKTIKKIDIYYEKIIKNITINDFKTNLSNQTFRDIERRGKHLIFILDNYILISHLRMEGKYHLKSNENITKHEHIVFTFTDDETLRYQDTRKFGTMFLYQTTDINEVLKLNPLNKVGFEPFDEDLDIDFIYSKFQKTNKPIKSTLLDQTIISGLGNIYVDEVCFLSKIHPTTPTKALTKDMVIEVIEISKQVLNKAIDLGGTTIRTFTSGHEISGRFQNSLLVHTKVICPTCSQKILKIRVGGRGTYVCENCQIVLDNK